MSLAILILWPYLRLGHGTCTDFESTAPFNQTAIEAQLIFAKIFVPKIAARLNADLAPVVLSIAETIQIMDLCPFSTVASPEGAVSPFCSLFTTDEWHSYNYYSTLGKYSRYRESFTLMSQCTKLTFREILRFRRWQCFRFHSRRGICQWDHCAYDQRVSARYFHHKQHLGWRSSNFPSWSRSPCLRRLQPRLRHHLYSFRSEPVQWFPPIVKHHDPRWKLHERLFGCIHSTIWSKSLYWENAMQRDQRGIGASRRQRSRCAFGWLRSGSSRTLRPDGFYWRLEVCPRWWQVCGLLHLVVYMSI